MAGTRRRSMSFSPRQYALAKKLAESLGYVHSKGRPHEGQPNPTKAVAELIEQACKGAGITVTDQEVEAVVGDTRKRRERQTDNAAAHFTF